MSLEIVVLAALFRLSRRARHGTLADLAERACVDREQLERVVARLAHAELVTITRASGADSSARDGESVRLTMTGLAVAVAADAQARRAKKVARPARPARMGKVTRLVPLVRRRRAA